MRQEFFSRTGILVFSVTILGILAFLFFGALIFVTLTAERSLSVVSGNALRDHISVASEHINRNVERYSLIANSLSTNQEIIHLVDNPLESNKAAGWVLIETKINFGFEEIFLFLDNGRVLFQNARDTSPYANEDFRPLVQKAVEFKTPSIFFFDSIIYQSPVLYVAVPVYGEGRSGVLVIGKVFNEKQLRNLAPAASQGILLFSKNNQKITANFYSSFFNQAITLKDYKEIFENAEQGEGFFKSFNQAEFSGIVGVVPVRFNSIPLGLMGFYVETKTQQQIQKNIAITASGALILLLVVFITAARFLHRLVVVPIGAIRDGFKRLAEGLFETSIPPQGLREVHEIGIGFNEMAVKLKEVYTDLEQKIKDRTKKLSETVGDLEGKNEEMERSKQAMLNLLEDEREAEEKIKQQSEDLRKAFADVQKFASVADQERNMYFLLLSSIGEGVLALDLERKITISNEIAERTLGFAKEELLGKKISEVLKFIHATKEPLEESFWSEAYAGAREVVLPLDTLVVGKANKTIPIVAVASAIKNVKTKQVNGIIITFRDVREERALDEARISFISVASHQLRTPLTSMRWFSEMLISGDAGAISEEQKHFVERIYEGTERMINLVNLLLQIARVEAGRVKIEPTMISFKNLLRGVSVALKGLLDAKSQKLEVKTIPDPFPDISMDQEVIWQVFQNILSNAIRYSPEKGTISVLVTQKGEFAEVMVKDSGIGIPKAQQDRVFEKFFRAENALKLVPEGSGLGLSLVKALVDGWGGKVWFESEESQGTTFYFTIPLSGMAPKKEGLSIAV